MTDQGVTFLFVMGAIALIAVVAFVIYLVNGRRGVEGSSTAEVSGKSSRVIWFEYVIAAVALTVIIAVGIILLFHIYPDGELARSGWRKDTRSDVFLSIMLLAIGGALVSFIIGVFIRRSNSTEPTLSREPESISADGAHKLASGSGIVGLLCILVGFLVFVWIAVGRPEQYQLMHHLLYPATFAVALVLVFDKATRVWSIKQPGETFREWVFCDAIVFLLFLAFLNLIQHADGETYVSIFWDVIHIAAFFLVFWLIDRRVTRYRFLVGYLYLALVPVLLWIWKMVQEQPAGAESGWWDSVWPFFFLGVIFGVIELIALVATRGTQRQAAGGLRDALFVALYGILLISVAA